MKVAEVIAVATIITAHTYYYLIIIDNTYYVPELELCAGDQKRKILHNIFTTQHMVND